MGGFAGPWVTRATGTAMSRRVVWSTQRDTTGSEHGRGHLSKRTHRDGGYAVTAAMTDHRIKALGTVSAVNIGASWRRGWYGTDPDSAALPTLDAAAGQRTAEAGGAEIAYAPYVPAEPDGNTPYDLMQAGEYYLTPHAKHPNAKNRYLMAKSLPKIFGYDAFHLVEDLLTQPILMVAGSDAGSRWPKPFRSSPRRCVECGRSAGNAAAL